MSDLIRALLARRQGSLGGSEMDLDNQSRSMQEQIAMAVEAGLISPEELMRAGLLPSGSIGQQMMERHMPASGTTIQNELAQGDPSAMMSPMVSSVVQLDR